MMKNLIQDLHDGGCEVDTAGSGRCLKTFGDARVYVVAPSPSFITSRAFHRPNLNNTSIAIRIQHGEVSFFFAGDAEKDAEGEMVRQYGGFLRSTLLKTGHHGSETSSSQEFLEVVRPGYAVISVGLFNKFGHPSADVVNRLHNVPAEVCRTDEEGAFMFESDGRTLSRIDWRED